MDSIKMIGLNVICEKGLPLKQTKDKKPSFGFLADDGETYIELPKKERGVSTTIILLWL